MTTHACVWRIVLCGLKRMQWASSINSGATKRLRSHAPLQITAHMHHIHLQLTRLESSIISSDIFVYTSCVNRNHPFDFSNAEWFSLPSLADSQELYLCRERDTLLGLPCYTVLGYFSQLINQFIYRDNTLHDNYNRIVTRHLFQQIDVPEPRSARKVKYSEYLPQISQRSESAAEVVSVTDT